MTLFFLCIAMSDYEFTRQFVTFTSLKSIQDVSVPIINDGSVELDELFLVRLNSTDGGDWLDLNSTTATVLVTNDDGKSQLRHIINNLCSTTLSSLSNWGSWGNCLG